LLRRFLCVAPCNMQPFLRHIPVCSVPNPLLTFLKASSHILSPKTIVFAIVSIATRATIPACLLAVFGPLRLPTFLLQAIQVIPALCFCLSSSIVFATSLTLKLKLSGSTDTFLSGVHFAFCTASSYRCTTAPRRHLIHVFTELKC
jgi:hypothetical protein